MLTAHLSRLAGVGTGLKEAGKGLVLGSESENVSFSIFLSCIASINGPHTDALTDLFFSLRRSRWFGDEAGRGSSQGCEIFFGWRSESKIGD